MESRPLEPTASYQFDPNLCGRTDRRSPDPNPALRIETLNQLRHVVFTATPQIRAQFIGLTPVALTNKA